MMMAFFCPSLSHAFSCKRALGGTRTSPQKAVKLFSQELKSAGEMENLLGVFQTPHLPGTGGELRKLPDYLLSMKESLDGDLSQAAIESYLEGVSPEAFRLTKEIVTKDNLQLFFFRHQSPEEMKEQKNEVFTNAFGEKRDQTGLVAAKGLERGTILDYSGAVLKGDESYYKGSGNLRSQANLLPKHAFLWFKRVPKNVRLEFIYKKMWRQSVFTEMNAFLDYFGYDIYEIDLKAVASRSLYRSGDLIFSSERNPYYAAMEETEEPYQSMFQNTQFNEGLISEATFKRAGLKPNSKKAKKIMEDISSPLVKARGTFAMDDLRGLFLYIFAQIQSDLERAPKAPVLIPMPGDEVFEVTIFGKLTTKDVKHKPDLVRGLFLGDGMGNPDFPNADFSGGIEN